MVSRGLRRKSEFNLGIYRAPLKAPLRTSLIFEGFYSSSSSSSSENEDVDSESSVESSVARGVAMVRPRHYNPFLHARRILIYEYNREMGLDHITASRRTDASVRDRPGYNPWQTAIAALQRHRELNENNTNADVVTSNRSNNIGNTVNSTNNPSASNTSDSNEANNASASNTSDSNGINNSADNTQYINRSNLGFHAGNTGENNSSNRSLDAGNIGENNSSNLDLINPTRQTPTEYIAELEGETPMDLIPMDD